MLDDSSEVVHHEAQPSASLWSQFINAQAGRWFFFTWVALHALALLLLELCNLVVFARGHDFHYYPFVIVTAAGQGWMVFRWQWRTWAWVVTAFLQLFLIESPSHQDQWLG